MSGSLQWDARTENLPLGFGVQGVLYLTDTAADQGGFQCVSGIHHELTDFGADHPPDYEYEAPHLKEFEPQPVPGKAGDLLIWHRALAHGSGHNTSNRPRIAQYLSMSPANPDNQEGLQSRIRLWRDRQPPASSSFPGDPRQWEKEHPQADLTSLGRKLLGLDAWD